MKNLKRFLISIAAALFLAGLTYFLAQAKAGPSSPVTMEQPQLQTQVDCYMCHPTFSTAWSNGAHGHSMSDTKFVEMWTDQGKPGACLVCHSTGYDPATGISKKTPFPAKPAITPSRRSIPLSLPRTRSRSTAPTTCAPAATAMPALACRNGRAVPITRSR